MSYVLIFEVILLLLLAVICDIRHYKIRNSINISFILVGLASNTAFYGFEGVRASVLGMALPVALLFLFFGLRMLGAGDIKLLAAVGSILGYPQIFRIIIFTFIAGGFIALTVILLRKNAYSRLKHIVNYFKQCFLTHSILRYTDFDDKSDGGKFRFSFAILAGTIISFLI